MFFNEKFKLQTPGHKLEFVNIPLDTDIRLFVDPYVFSIIEDPWYIECNNLIVDFFETLINTIKKNDIVKAINLMDMLHEPNDTHLGHSQEKPCGKGIGQDQSMQILKKLSKSKAVKTGLLKHLSDCELLIAGISYDKISDMTVNIIRGQLVEFTENQCKKHDIPVQKVSSGYYWDSDNKIWTQRSAHLPVHNSKQILLIPKNVAKPRMAVNQQEYYRNYILERLQEIHLAAATSLVKVLKNGKRKVSKKDLKKQHPFSKDFLLEFSEKHPDTFEKYKRSLEYKAKY